MMGIESKLLYWKARLRSPSSIRDLEINDAVLIYMNKKSFLKCGNCNNLLKLILVTCKQFSLARRCPIC